MADFWNKYEPTAARKRGKPGRETRPKSLTVDMHAHVAVPRVGEIMAPHLKHSTDPLVQAVVNAPVIEFAASNFKVEQIETETHHVDVNFATVPRVDRCITCHKAIDRKERRARHKARAALQDFPRKRWKQWRRNLPKRANALPFHDLHFAAIALRRLKEAVELDRRRRRSPSRVGYHRLRIALKRFRYTLESFLPAQSVAWGPTLKLLQSRLGEIHDLDVLRSRILKFGRENPVPPSVQTRQLAVMERARKERIDRCEKLISCRPRSGGSPAHRPSLWDRWRQELDVLIGITLPDREEPSRSAPRRVSLLAARRIPPPNRRLRLS